MVFPASEQDQRTLPSDNAFQMDGSGMGWALKDVTSHKEVVVRAMEKCRVELSKDLRKGGTYNVQTSRGVLPIYFPDQADINKNTVRAFKSLMLFFFDDIATKKIIALEEKVKGAYDVFLKKYIQVEYSEMYKNKAIKTGTIQFGEYSQVGKQIEEEMQKYILDLNWRVFEELVLLFKRKKELSGKTTASIY